MAVPPIFDEALTKVFSHWTLLALAVEQGWGGRDSRAKRAQLLVEVTDRLADGARRRRPPSYQNDDDVQDLADFLFNRVMQLFSAEANDGSAEEVASVCLRLHNTCRAGDNSFAQQFLQGFQAADLSKCQGSEHIEYATEEDRLIDGMQGMDIETAEGIEEGSDESMDESGDVGAADGRGKGAGAAVPVHDMEAEAACADAAASRQEKPEPTVDEDGFVSVVKGRRRPR